MNQIWAHKGTRSSESVLLDIHGVVRREGNSQKRKAGPCKTVCFTSCLHILALHVLIDSPLELSLALASYCCCCMKLLSDKVLQYQQAPNLENYEVSFSDALAMPKRYPRDTP